MHTDTYKRVHINFKWKHRFYQIWKFIYDTCIRPRHTTPQHTMYKLIKIKYIEKFRANWSLLTKLMRFIFLTRSVAAGCNKSKYMWIKFRFVPHNCVQSNNQPSKQHIIIFKQTRQFDELIEFKYNGRRGRCRCVVSQRIFTDCNAYYFSFLCEHSRIALLNFNRKQLKIKSFFFGPKNRHVLPFYGERWFAHVHKICIIISFIWPIRFGIFFCLSARVFVWNEEFFYFIYSTNILFNIFLLCHGRYGWRFS